MQPTSGLHFPLAYDLSRDIGIKETIGHAAALLDADGDGLLDVLLAGPDRIELFRNLGNWKFTRVSEAGFRQPGYWQGVAVGDVDNEGRPDVFLSGFGCAALYLNKGGCRFADVTAGSGLDDVPPDAWQTSAGFRDVDLDGRLDLYVGRYVDLAGRTGVCEYPGGVVSACSPAEFEAQRGVFYRNMGAGRFANETEKHGLGNVEGKALGVAFSDLDQDGYADLYIANDQVPCDLYLNERGQRFIKIGVASGTAYGIHGGVQAGMGAAVGDYDDDGLLDLIVTNYRGEPASIYHNDGKAHFSNNAYLSGLGFSTTPYVGWGVQWVDFDNDGRLDLAMANGHPVHRIRELDEETDTRQPFQIFRNLGQGRFREEAILGEGLPRPIAGRALCAGDLDNDGRVDLLISDIEGQPLLLRNVTPAKHRWLRVRLSGPGVTEGAIIRLRLGSTRLTRHSTTSGSYLSASDPRVHFGCGTAVGPALLEVSWPGGATTVRESSLDTEVVLTREMPNGNGPGGH
jgi:hypothetical protein